MSAISPAVIGSAPSVLDPHAFWNADALRLGPDPSLGAHSLQASPLLELRLSVDYRNNPGVLRDVSLNIQPGEILGLVGQSGSGKSAISLAILRLLHLKGGTARGTLLFKGEDLSAKSESQMRSLRGREISIVLQSPLTSLNPALRIGSQLSEAWRAHAAGTREQCAAAIRSALSSVSLPHATDFLRRRSSQLSVGQAQRVIIAMAILHRPSLLIADEATSALDTITQSEILTLFARLNRELGMGIRSYIPRPALRRRALPPYRHPSLRRNRRVRPPPLKSSPPPNTPTPKN